jgi:hypothetical protein
MMKAKAKSNDQRRPLTEVDSPLKTLGCRHSNPDICRNNSTEGQCAFVRADGICLTPPRSWKKIFGELNAHAMCSKNG